jgi:hypothetical protein
MRRLVFCSAVAAGATVFLASGATAAVVYSTDGSTYSQDFDSLPNSPTNTSLGNTPSGWIDDTSSPGAGQFSIVGWYLNHPTSTTEGGANGHQRLRAGSGSSTTGAFYSFGANSSTERALGDLGATTLAADDGTGVLSMALRLTNNTGTTLNSFSLSYTGEQWHTSTATADPMTVDFATDVSGSDFVGTGTFTPVPGLTFASTVSGAAEAALDGNDPANRSALSATNVPVNWAPGTDLWIRWSDIQVATLRDHGNAIDDLSFSATAVPEPASLGLVVLGTAAGTVRRPRRRR